MTLIDNLTGNYRFLTGLAPYSAGVLAMPGYEIVHATLRQPLPYHQGFNRIAEHLEILARPRAALCAIELRAPRPFTFAGFAAFNQEYQALLTEWDLLLGADNLVYNPITRTNIAPAVQPPGQPCLYAFSYTVPVSDATDEDTPPTFIVAGAGDLRDQANLAVEAIVCPGDVSASGMREKMTRVMDVMRARLQGLAVAWDDVTCANVYTIQTLQPHLAMLLEQMGSAAKRGVHWHYSQPPIAGLDFEMDMRGVRQEVWIGE